MTPAGSTRPNSWKHVGPVEARVHERLDRLHALFAHRDEARVRRQPFGRRLRLLGLRRERARPARVPLAISWSALP